MAKKLDPQEIEQSRRKKTRADNREERKERIHDGIRKNRESGGVIIIPPPPSPYKRKGRLPEKCVLQLMSVSAHRKNSK